MRDHSDPTFQCWNAMMQRCTNPANPGWQRYGGRGITVCAAWHKFDGFVADMGTKPVGFQIERKNVDGNYEPGNCKWATALEQANNRRTNVFLVINGVRLTKAQWARKYGIDQRLLHSRLRGGWTLPQALTTPRLPGDRNVRLEIRVTRKEKEFLLESFRKSHFRRMADWFLHLADHQ